MHQESRNPGRGRAALLARAIVEWQGNVVELTWTQRRGKRDIRQYRRQYNYN